MNEKEYEEKEQERNWGRGGIYLYLILFLFRFFFIICLFKQSYVLLKCWLLDLPRYQHAVWLENVDSECNCFACSKCQMRVFNNPNAFQRHIRSCGGKIKDKQLTVSRTEDIIDPYFAGDQNVKYLTCTDQMD
jgi:hypothetical protein